LKKPPLYAWCTTLLAQAVGRFDEQIARLPSAVAGTFLVLLLYAVGEAGLGRGAGFPTAALTLANLTVVDYATRAELDLGFSVLTTVSILLAYPALHRRGVTRFACWLACYLAVTLAALWKGPHSLIFLWAPLVAYGWRRRHWSWLWHPGQLVGLLLSLGVLVGWTVTLSGHAGARTVGKMAVIELVSRLIPLSFGDLLSVLYVVPIMFVVILPASLFVVAGFRAGVVYEADDRPADRSPRAVARFCVDRFRRWWSALAAKPFTEFLLYWLGANLVWCAVVPAKSPRYWLPMFAPALLLAGDLLRRQGAGLIGRVGRRHVEDAWRIIYGAIGVVGLAGLILALVMTVSPDLSIGGYSVGPSWAWLALGLGWVLAAALGFGRWINTSTARRCLGLIVVALAAKPVSQAVWWTGRAQSDSQRRSAQRIDELVPPGQPVFVLGTHEFHDVAFYCRRRFDWIDHPAQVGEYTDAAEAYCLLRTEDLAERVTDHGIAPETLFEFIRADHQLVLIRIDR
ncbi:MAG: glycosyltransferase family 39 protein, partial [Planctomycetes bacterium]|nr:glycosyltransferase family 39 protein [Planctomycetota bacterium]